ncbi:TBC1 domain family member 5 isoform X1 [Choristoneura fumiferana]|uniref:TBC1 domain family member 5 isoform X1 n=1 Tax=Choristoneura fumiferana TaxID=7141 RepID=UPI003D15C586
MAQNNGTASPSNSSFPVSDYELEVPAWSLEGLRAAATQLRLPRPRSLAWAILLNALPPPNADIVASLRTHRNFYNDMKAKLSMDPRTVIGDDPLSQNDESAWNQHFCDNELKALILQDVVRTFPDELYFRDKDVQDMMVLSLFYWARAHAHVGYRQGMHEVLAPLLLQLRHDTRHAPRDLSNTLKYILDEEYLEHDSYMLFSAVMKGLEKFYTTGDVVPSSCGRLPVSTVVHNPNEVVRYLDKVRDECLAPLDSDLAAHLTQCNISMELFGIRWLRLLFGREFPRAELPALWGFLFADGPLLPHIHYVIVAILIAIKPTLMSEDPGTVLSALMRPVRLPAAHAVALALHLRRPLEHPRPAPPPQDTTHEQEWSLEQRGYANAGSDSGSEGVAEGADIARSLAALGLLRAQLPPAAAALARELPAAPPRIAVPLQTILKVTPLTRAAARAAAARRRRARQGAARGAAQDRRAAADHPQAGSPPRVPQPRPNRRRNSPRSGRGRHSGAYRAPRRGSRHHQHQASGEARGQGQRGAAQSVPPGGVREQ